MIGGWGYTLVSDAGSLLFIFGVVLALSSLIGFAEATVRLPPGSRQWPA
jgi:hypothetical protein